tara:strand:- start:424 stop:1125 length:702 start_codon:yes stop_codon:yes gene_type:complete
MDEQPKSLVLTFRDILDASATNLSSGSTLSISDVILGLIASLVCAAIISWTYRAAYQGVLYQKSFNISLIMICLVTTSVIMVISGNLILSLGMVGALSIVRFRSAIKDPMDIVFMFWSVAVGIANGVANVKVSFTSTLIIAFVLLVLTRIPMNSKAYMLIIRFEEDAESEVEKVVSSNVKKYSLKSKNLSEDFIEIIAEIRVNNTTHLSRELNSIDKVKDVNILSLSSNILDT